MVTLDMPCDGTVSVGKTVRPHEITFAGRCGLVVGVEVRGAPSFGPPLGRPDSILFGGDSVYKLRVSDRNGLAARESRQDDGVARTQRFNLDVQDLMLREQIAGDET